MRAEMKAQAAAKQNIHVTLAYEHTTKSPFKVTMMILCALHLLVGAVNLRQDVFGWGRDNFG